MMDSGQHIATGYNGPGIRFGYKNLYFYGDERKFEIWDEKFLGYMKIKKLKDILAGTGEVTQDDNEDAYSELIQILDERSISLIMRDAKDDARKAYKIVRDLYGGSSKPRVIALYTQLTSLPTS